MGRRRIRPVRRKTNSRRPPSRRVRRSRRLPSVPQARSSLGQAVTNGVRSVITLLPGQRVLQPIADAFFRYVGLSANVVQSTASTIRFVEGDASIYAAGALFAVKYVNLLSGSRLGVVSGAGPHPSYLSEMYEGRLIRLDVSIAPQGALGKRNGNWTLGFQPFLSTEDLKFYIDFKQVPDRDMILRFLCNTTGSASDKLSLRYTPRPSDGWAFQFHTVDTAFGVIALRYEEPNRTGYGEFSSDDFAVSTVVSGRVECRRPPPAHAANPRSFPDVISDCLETVGMTILDSTNNKTYVIENDKNLTIKDQSEGANCHFKGKVISSVGHNSFDWEMAEEEEV